MSEFIKSLSLRLFWDVDPSEIDAQAHRRFIIQRVLERGSLDDIRATISHYTMPFMISLAQQIRAFTHVTLAFAACIGNVKEETFKAKESEKTRVHTIRTSGTSTSLRMEFDCKSASANAHGLTRQGMSFIVLKRAVLLSGIMPSLKTRTPGYHKLRCRLENDGTIVNGVFTRDCDFASPSAAASVVMGRPSNGRIAWIAADGRSLKEVQEEWRV